MQLRRLRMLLGGIAEENRPLLAFEQAPGDRLAGRAGIDRIESGRHRLALQLCRRLDDRSQCQRQFSGRNGQLRVQIDQRSSPLDESRLTLPHFLAS
jgi:hypothetical protein